MFYFVKILKTTNQSTSILYSGTTIAILAQKIKEMMAINGYKSIEDDSGGITFEKGNRRIWLLTLGSTKYFRFSITMITANENEVVVNLFKKNVGKYPSSYDDHARNQIDLIDSIMQAI